MRIFLLLGALALVFLSGCVKEQPSYETEEEYRIYHLDGITFNILYPSTSNLGSTDDVSIVNISATNPVNLLRICNHEVCHIKTTPYEYVSTMEHPYNESNYLDYEESKCQKMDTEYNYTECLKLLEVINV